MNRLLTLVVTGFLALMLAGCGENNAPKKPDAAPAAEAVQPADEAKPVEAAPAEAPADEAKPAE